MEDAGRCVGNDLIVAMLVTDLAIHQPRIILINVKKCVLKVAPTNTSVEKSVIIQEAVLIVLTVCRRQYLSVGTNNPYHAVLILQRFPV